MQKWEYTVIRTKKYMKGELVKALQGAINKGSSNVELYRSMCNRDAEKCTEYLLNKLGSDGWELVCSLPSYDEDNEEYLQHILKRSSSIETI